jgi:ribose transport system substrate-binding protein
MKVRLGIAIAALSLCVFLAACGSSGSSSSTPESTEAETTEPAETSESSETPASEEGGSGENYTLTFIPGVTGASFYEAMNCGIEAKAKELGNVEYEGEQGAAEFTPTAQTPVVNAVTSAGPDAVLIAPTDDTAMAGPVGEMKSKGITIVEVDTALKNEELSVARVSSDNIQGGELAAEELAKEIGEEGAVAVISFEPGVYTDDLRKEGFENKIKEYPKIEFVGTQYDKENAATATSDMEALLSAHSNLNGVFTTDYTGANGAAVATKAAGKAGTVKIVSFDASAELIELLEENVVAGIVSQSPFQEGELGVELAVESLEGGTPTPKTLIPTKYITKENLNSPEIQEYIYHEKCS